MMAKEVQSMRKVEKQMEAEGSWLRVGVGGARTVPSDAVKSGYSKASDVMVHAYKMVQPIQAINRK